MWDSIMVLVEANKKIVSSENNKERSEQHFGKEQLRIIYLCISIRRIASWRMVGERACVSVAQNNKTNWNLDHHCEILVLRILFSAFPMFLLVPADYHKTVRLASVSLFTIFFCLFWDVSSSPVLWLFVSRPIVNRFNVSGCQRTHPLPNFNSSPCSILVLSIACDGIVVLLRPTSIYVHNC